MRDGVLVFCLIVRGLQDDLQCWRNRSCCAPCRRVGFDCFGGYPYRGRLGLARVDCVDDWCVSLVPNLFTLGH